MAGNAVAEMISGNFCSVANVQNPPAGLFEALTWNDFTAPAGFGGFDSSSNVAYEGGAPATGVTVTWGGSSGVSQNTNDDVFRPAHIQDGHDEMMAGYLQASKFGEPGFTPLITLEVTGLDVAAFGGSYSVILYFDGDGDVEGSGAVSFEISDGVIAAPAVYGRDGGSQYAVDNDGTDPLSLYTPITSSDALNPTTGNYVLFTGLTGEDFTATLTGNVNEHGVALNGFQIIPEPATLLLVCGGLLLFRRRS